MPAGVILPELHDFRRRIDAIDDRILGLLGDRFAVIREVAAFKAPRGIPAVIPERVKEVCERCAALAPSHGLEPEFLRRLYTLIIDEACRQENRLMAGPGSAGGT
jgi:4-amino-4-deoxychorismate mutase